MSHRNLKYLNDHRVVYRRDPIDMPQCMPDEYKDKCSVKAYWNYYIGEKHTVANKKTEKIYE